MLVWGRGCACTTGSASERGGLGAGWLLLGVLGLRRARGRRGSGRLAEASSRGLRAA
ncbi:Hypothetical protein CAP_6403 [Chondromyces apiculatus DSM 436]|uniref:Uncharacterized protein n=1 Tax=Chondromyces apiculatus DSM 436 TaxID=1192034 RepID=A0A017T0R4_9BACT|nr:Hypothetical protein CAP_6403 [Chondromyces apiculatus DSM 436]